jgi:hypothetical protein
LFLQAGELLLQRSQLSLFLPEMEKRIIRQLDVFLFDVETETGKAQILIPTSIYVTSKSV